ncbi:MAG: hypothetical protein RIF32_04930 [Leptospirales bacterium]|jgi:hypothetical protein
METINETTTYYEVVEQKEKFQEILRLLVYFDERCGRVKEYEEPELHYMRKIVATCDPGRLRVFVRHLGAHVYYIVAEVHLAGGTLATGYVHEDGIAAERIARASDPAHPVHTVDALSDLLLQGQARSASEDWGPSRPGQAAIDLMNDESLWLD